MSAHDEHLPAELRDVATRLREQRAEADPLRLDELKRQVLARSVSSGPVRTLFSRLATIAATLSVIGAGGGALALAQLDSHPNTHGGAATAQYQSPGSGNQGASQGPSSGVGSNQGTQGHGTQGQGVSAASPSASTSAGQSTTPSSTSTSGTRSSLPFTGEDLLTVALIGMLLTGAGVMLRDSRGRRRNSSS